MHEAIYYGTLVLKRKLAVGFTAQFMYNNLIKMCSAELLGVFKVYEILKLLEKDCRLTAQQIAAMLDMDVAAVEAIIAKAKRTALF